MASSINEGLVELLKGILIPYINKTKYRLDQYLQSEKFDQARELSIEIMQLCRFLEYLNTQSLEMFFAETNRNIPKSLPG